MPSPRAKLALIGGALAIVGCHPDRGRVVTPAGPAVPTKLTAAEIVKRSTPAIVQIEATSERGVAVGTGFIVDRSGLIATNLHVVIGTANIKVHLLDGSTFAVAHIAGFDADRDLALISIAAPKPLPVLALGDSDGVVPGDPIVAIGNPLGVFEDTVSAGLISQVRVVCGPADVRDKKCSPLLTVLQISAPISQGSSGGPLFNQFGDVVGVTTAIITEGQNINLAVPTNYLKPLIAKPGVISLEDFAAHTKPQPEEGAGEPDHAHIVRKVPVHELKLLDGCTQRDLENIAQAIALAIKSGAPLYNAGNHEACYRIYEGTAVKWEHDAPCAGVRSAFGDGLLRAGTLETFTEKAWAMRDTFDGLIEVSERWVQAHPTTQAPPHLLPPPPAHP